MWVWGKRICFGLNKMKCGVMGGWYFFWWEESKDIFYFLFWYLEMLM